MPLLCEVIALYIAIVNLIAVPIEMIVETNQFETANYYISENNCWSNLYFPMISEGGMLILLLIIGLSNNWESISKISLPYLGTMIVPYSKSYLPTKKPNQLIS